MLDAQKFKAKTVLQQIEILV